MSAPEPRTPDASAPAEATDWRGGLWLRVGLVCGLLVASGLVRARQDERISGALDREMESPVDLEAVPLVLGPWQGEDVEIEPLIARVSGARQIVTRRYVNQTTGDRVDCILVFGRASQIYGHTPEVCYPAAGYAPEVESVDRSIDAGDERFPFRALYYAKGEGARTEHEEVLYTWWYGGRWTPAVGSRQNFFERISAMYKVQVARRLAPGEAIGFQGESPAAAFLRVLMPELQRRMASRAAPVPAA